MKKGDIVKVRDFMIYPNPESNNLFAVVTLPDSDGDMKVFDIKVGEARFVKADGVKNVKGEVPFTVASKRAFGYTFAAGKRGKKIFLSAGCRLFTSVKEAREHWSNGPKGHHYEFKDDDYYWNDRKEQNKKHLAKMLEVYQEMKEKL